MAIRGLWLPFLSIMLSSSSTLPCLSSSSPVTAEYHSWAWRDHFLFIHSSADGRLSCFLLLAVVTGAVMNIRVQVFI